METIGAVKLEERKRQFMTAVDFSDQRQRRETFAIELRRQKRNETANKRRLLSSNTYSIQSSEARGQLTLDEIPSVMLEAYPQLKDLSGSDLDRAVVLKSILQTPNLPPDYYYHSMVLLRKSISRDSSPPIHIIMSLGLVPMFLGFINPLVSPIEIIFEATWVLCNVASGPHEAAEAIVNAGGIPLLISIIDPSEPAISEHAIWALGNIAGDYEPYRDLIINSRGHEAVVSFILRSEHIDTLHAKAIAWAMTCFLRGKVRVPLNVCEELIKGVGQLAKIDELEVQRDVLWSLSHISDGDNDFTQLVINSGLCKQVIRNISPTQDLSLVNPAVRVMGNIVSGDDLMTQYAMDLGLLDKLEEIVTCRDGVIRKEVMWALSNVTAGTKDQIQLFLSHKISREVIKALEDPELAVRKEAGWIFSNIAKKGKPEQKLSLVEMGIFEYIKFALTEDAELIFRALDTIRELLAAGLELRTQQNSPVNICCQKLEECGCLHALEQLQVHPNPQISEQTLRLIGEFFGFEEGSGALKDAPEPDTGFRF